MSGLPKEAAEVLTTAGGPREDPIVSSKGRRHNVTLCLVTWVTLPIMDHPKTGENGNKQSPHVIRYIATPIKYKDSGFVIDHFYLEQFDTFR